MDKMGTPQSIVIAGAGYAGLHVALRLARLAQRKTATLTLIDQHPYHQVTTGNRSSTYAAGASCSADAMGDIAER